MDGVFTALSPHCNIIFSELAVFETESHMFSESLASVFNQSLVRGEQGVWVEAHTVQSPVWEKRVRELVANRTAVPQLQFPVPGKKEAFTERSNNQPAT